MSRDLNALQKKFRDPVHEMIAAVAARGLSVEAFSTKRTPEEQACLWRMTRSRAVIINAVEMLRHRNANYLAGVLLEVGPQYPRPGQRGHSTNALPGESWHCYALAVDCYGRDANGDLTWDPEHEVYRVYHEEALAAGLYLGPEWDAVHVQHSEVHNPRKHYGSWKRVDEVLREMNGA